MSHSDSESSVWKVAHKLPAQIPRDPGLMDCDETYLTHGR